MKHIRNTLKAFDVPIPLVKLHLPNNQCRSAITGIMYQPRKDQLCTFQVRLDSVSGVCDNSREIGDCLSD